MFEVIDEPLDGHDWPAVVGDRNYVGPLAPAVPGAVAGLWAAHQRAGRLAWADLLAPAIELAEAGLEVTWVLQIEIANRVAEIVARPELAAILLPEGRIPRAATPTVRASGSTRRTSRGTLRWIAAEGPDAFYRGEVAAAIAGAVARGGGIMTVEDLAGYTPRVLTRCPRATAALSTSPRPTRSDTRPWDPASTSTWHPATRPAPKTCTCSPRRWVTRSPTAPTYANDPDFTTDPVTDLGGPAFAATRAAAIRADRAAPGRSLPTRRGWRPASRRAPRRPGAFTAPRRSWPPTATATWPPLITTIGADFGSLVAVPGTGIILNNSMINYDPRPGRSNSIAPGKMPFFAVPALVAARDGRAALRGRRLRRLPDPRRRDRHRRSASSTTVSASRRRSTCRACTHRAIAPSSTPGRTPDASLACESVGHDVVVQDVDSRRAGLQPSQRGRAVHDGTLTAGAGPAWSTAAGGL